jgi:hypothetical protein
MIMPAKGYRIKIADDVAILLQDVTVGDEVVIFDDKNGQDNENALKFIALESIRAGHKIAIENIKKGAALKKYGSVIGMATQNIRRGEHVHTHNLESLRGRGDKQ